LGLSGRFLKGGFQGVFGDRKMGTVPCGKGDGCVEDRVESAVTPAAAVQVGVPATSPAGEPVFDIEVVKIEKKWNIKADGIASKIKDMILSHGDGYAVLFHHSTWGSCRVVKFLIMNVDGSYLPDGEWDDHSSRKNANKWKIMPLKDFITKYAGKELSAFLYVSPSCNKSRQFSFRAIFKVVTNAN
jgi:hypothetical protein